jgi:hypothetical protein
MLSKLLWEIQQLTDAMSVWKEDEGFPEAIFMAFTVILR